MDQVGENARRAVRRGPGLIRHDREHNAEESICITWGSYRLTRLICPIGAQIGARPGAMPAQECLIGRLLDERAPDCDVTLIIAMS